ncbi:efflux RND transporter periplasmic adaptor subunit [bacterium]|nr:efflux RND transporter periplasmic adaptor subunit [bacterium]
MRELNPSPRVGWHRRLWRVVRLLILVPIARLRFLFVLGAIGLVILKWDDLVARYEKLVWPADTAAAGDPGHEFYCPMHPTVIRDTNKEKCPICFMPLSKRKKGEVTDEALSAGTVSRVQLTPYRVVLAGVRTVPVGFHPLTRDLTTVGTVEFDERNLRAVSARVKGRIDKLFVNQTGQMVHRNDPLAEVYSPDLVVTAQNLIDARGGGNKVLEGMARDRLRLWGIDDAQIDELAKAGRPITHLTVRSPITGHILKKAVREGQYVEEGGPLFDVADLSTVWVQAQLYEDDLAFLPAGGHDRKTGRPDFDLGVAATTRAFPNRAFSGKLSFLFPHVDTDTRTLTVRFELPNPDHELRPGMTATVGLKLTPDLLAKTPAGDRLQARDGKLLAVSEPAVIDTGTQKVVYRETLPNTFEGVLVTLGPRLRDPDGATFYPVLSGVSEGDRVVTAGSFLLDAETRLNPALGSTYIGGGGGGGGKAGGVVRPTTPDDESAKITAALAKLSPEDRQFAQTQRFCPVLGGPLGAMGVPVKITLEGRPVFLCCRGCVAEANANPGRTLGRVEEFRRKGGAAPPPPATVPPANPTPPAPPKGSSAVPKLTAEEVANVRANLAKLPVQDRAAAEAQKLCPIQGEPVGSMGVPVKVDLGGGRTVFVCCRSCVTPARSNPDEALGKASDARRLPPLLPGGQP